MRVTILLLSLVYISESHADELGIIDGFSIEKIRIFKGPSKDEKLEKIPSANIPVPIRIEAIDPKNKYYQITLNGKPIWVKKRNVTTNNVKVDCLTLSSNMSAHVAGSKALASPNCK